MRNKMELKKASNDKDFEIISALAEKIWTEHYTSIIGAAQVRYMLTKFSAPEKIRKDILEDRYFYYMVFYDSAIAGYIALKPESDKKTVFLSKLYVDKLYRRLGISRYIIDFIKSEFKPKGYSSVWLTVNKNNLGSIEAYKKLGFQNIDSIITDIGGGFVMDDYKMRLDF